MRNLQIIDANLNRAREAARVIEDFLRFEFHLKNFTLEIKQLRHFLGSVQEKFGLYVLAERDVHSDRTKFEIKQTGKSILARNFKRLQEALRVLEEATKPLVISKKLLKARFSTYDIEKRVMMFFDKKGKLANKKLYVLIDADLCRNPVQLAKQVSRGGADIVQLRSKKLSDSDFLKLAISMKKQMKRTMLIINDRVDITQISDADGVHLGNDDVSINEARQILSAGKIIGRTTHNLKELKDAVKQGADYVSVGPIFKTRLKPNLKPLGLEYLQSAKSLGIPFFCVGGINLNNLAFIQGCPVAVCSYIINSKHPSKAVKDLKKRILFKD